jgi:phytanoyl-CoA hydroxylase
MTITSPSQQSVDIDDAKILATYNKDGIIQIPAVFTREEIDALNELFMIQVATDHTTLALTSDAVPEGDILATFPRFVQPHRRPDLAVGQATLDWMLNPRLLGIVEKLIGPALGAQSMFYFKPPTARGQAMHQDNTFLQAFPEMCLAVWIALDDVDQENGGLAVVPGSHAVDLMCPEEADREFSFTQWGVQVPEGMEAEQTVMSAGDVLFFHGAVVHGSGPNYSKDRYRRSLVLHYVPASSTEVGKFYLPLVSPANRDVFIEESEGGGPCGVGFELNGEA